MGLFNLFKKKKDDPFVNEVEKKAVPKSIPDETEDSDIDIDGSLSFSISKESLLEDISKDLNSGPESITNEEILIDTELLDTYKVVSDAIKGGMGSVWKVHHKSWNKYLAMKRPQPGFFAEGSEKRKENFIRECESWINLGLHPNIVSCYYVREIGGVPTIFSEWMENGSLKNRIDDGSLYIGTYEEVQARLLDIAIQSCRGLHYAHESNEHLIHQDVKPDNLLLTKSWEAKVADFGLAKARTQLQAEEKDGTPGSDQNTDTRLTHIAPTGGYTPAYCSREQFLGEALTRRTDIYSWAVSMLEMYLGRRPWKNGREAGQQCEDYFGKARIPMTDDLKRLLSECLRENEKERPYDFAEVEGTLKEIYRKICGTDYPREESDAAADTADSLNNRALSFLDLGMNDEAEELFKQAIEKDGSRFLYHFNYAMYQWNQRRISDRKFLKYLNSNLDTSDLCKKKMAILHDMRGGRSGWEAWVEPEDPFRWKDREEILYLYSIRPEDLEPLLRPSETSVDGKYRVTGYEEKDNHGITDYGYRIEDLVTGEIREYPIEYDDYKDLMENWDYYESMRKRSYPGYNSSNVFFIGPKSEFVVMERSVLFIFDSETGRLLVSVPPIPSDHRDKIQRIHEFYIVGYTQSGVIEYALSENNWARARRMCTDETLSYEIAEFSTTDARLDAEKSLVNNYEEALSCWNRNDIEGTYRTLKRSLEEQVLTMHEPSLHLWSELRKYYETDGLVTVVPTHDDPTPLPDNLLPLKTDHQNEYEKINFELNYPNKSNNGQTAFSIILCPEREYDNSTNCYEFKYYYKLYTADIGSKNSYYKIKYLESANMDDFNYLIEFTRHHEDSVRLEGDYLLWYKTMSGWCKINLAELSRESDGRVSFTLPGGYSLKNTKEGVDIGGFVFDDTFIDFRPLWDSDVIACRENNYRLVYRYKEK